MTNNIIKEGGVAGHMNHLYENPYLTFEEMKDIIQKAGTGELEGTEKTDGQNLFISYSVKSGKAVAARNKGNIKSGGLDAAGLAKKFKDRGALENAFNDAFSAFEQAASKLSPEAQLKLFGQDAEIYYNSEVQDPESPNVIHYDEPNLVIHKVGHVRVVGQEGEKELKPFNIKGVDHFFNELIRHGDRDAEAQRFRLQKNAVRRLEAISDGAILDATLKKLERELSKVGISDNQTVMEYVVARIKPLLQNIELPEEQYEMFARKHLDYGLNNIALGGDIVNNSDDKQFSLTGLCIRLTDKISRLKNLLVNGRSFVEGEGMEDTFIDIANYGIIGLLVGRDKWKK